eukprot:TRINITY_DN2515_c1_g1_i1.p1 TRINITY_DN2515_c1_g1~~TRINITY_DN2515_c1_g1_i1.p1  ORF type:complete len:116 (+),score=16.73 TRINITY_DN2515_c1_g1_i1:34-381(+)
MPQHLLDTYSSHLRMTQRVKLWSDWMESLKGNIQVIEDIAPPPSRSVFCYMRPSDVTMYDLCFGVGMTPPRQYMYSQERARFLESSALMQYNRSHYSPVSMDVYGHARNRVMMCG